MCNCECNGQVRTGRSGHHRTRSDHRGLSGVTCGVYGEHCEFGRTPDRVFKTAAFNLSAIPPHRNCLAFCDRALPPSLSSPKSRRKCSGRALRRADHRFLRCDTDRRPRGPCGHRHSFSNVSLTRRCSCRPVFSHGPFPDWAEPEERSPPGAPSVSARGQQAASSGQQRP